MKVKHTDLAPQEGNPFARCKLGREDDANALNLLIESIEGGGTIAINGAWGFGKTTFLRMWQQDLEQRGYRVILFNAWETDFSTEPLVSILGELREIILPEKKKQYDEMIRKASIFSKKGLPTLASLLTGNSSLESLLKTTIECFEQEVREYTKQKEEFQSLRNSLEDLVLCDRSSKPVIFIVDELDRCRPDYAVEVLEKIKHLFSVNNLIFVLAVDKEQLCHAIKGYYGSSELNASEYLRRFIDIEYNLGCSDYESIVRHFFDYFDISDLNNSPFTRSHLEIRIISIISEEQHLSIRQIEKWVVHLKVMVLPESSCSLMQPSAIILLTFLELFYPRIYDGIKRISFSLPTLIQETKNLFINRLMRELENINTPARTLVIALCILYLSYHQSLITTRHPLRLNSMGVEQNQEEILDAFFQDISAKDVSQLKKKIINVYQYDATSTIELVNPIYSNENAIFR